MSWHEKLQTYLLSRGWKLEPGPRQIAEIYVRTSSGRRFVVRVPVDPSREDFMEETIRAFERVAAFEGRHVAAVLAEAGMLAEQAVPEANETDDERTTA